MNYLNVGLAWGLLPLHFAAAGLAIERIAILSAIYPVTWGVCQLVTGALSDRVGRKWMIAGGMWLQAIAIVLFITPVNFALWFFAAVLLGVGTAMVYPTLLAAIGDVVDPLVRASSVGVYRLWRDSGYAFGALLSGFVAHALGQDAAIAVVAALTLGSGAIVALRMRETLAPTRTLIPQGGSS